MVKTSNESDADATVFLFPTDRLRWADARNSTRAFRSVRVSKTGAFSVTALPAGEYFVVATLDDAEASWPDQRLLTGLAAVAKTIQVMAGQRAAVTLTTTKVR